MAKIKPLANRHNVIKPSDGNSPFKFTDSTAKVAAVITGGKPSGGSKKGKGCASCGR